MGYFEIQDKVRAEPIKKVFGDGKPGPKTLGLERDEKAARESHILVPDRFSLTKKAFSRYLDGCGAFDAKRPVHADDCISNADFPAELRDMITEGVLALGLLRPAVMVRSDEYAGGVGLWRSGPAAVTDKTDVKGLVDRIEQEIKRVLISDFQRDVAEFKRKKGITGNPGIMVTPLYGEGICGNIVPCIPMNCLYAAEGQQVLSVGLGLGGANGYLSEHGYNESYISVARRMLKEVQNPIKLLKMINVLNTRGHVEERNLAEDRELYSLLLLLQPLAQSQAILFYGQQRLEDFFARTGPRYVELVSDDFMTQYLLLVQSAIAEPKQIVKPDMDKRSVVMATGHVIGTKVVRSDVLRFAEGAPGENDYRFNKENEGYVLVVDTTVLPQFLRDWKLHAFSNAGAVIVSLDQQLKPILSHLGGLFRELDIPLLVGNLEGIFLKNNLEGIFLKNLKGNPTQNKKCVVYANEFKREGVLEVEHY